MNLDIREPNDGSGLPRHLTHSWVDDDAGGDLMRRRRMELEAWAMARTESDQPLYMEFSEARDVLASRRLPQSLHGVFTWDIARRFGLSLPVHRQETGDCVAWGMAWVLKATTLKQMFARGQEQRFREPYEPWIYGTSRNQIGGGMTGAGSRGIWAARAVNRYGVLFRDDPDVPTYTGRIADTWGSRANSGDIRRAIYGSFADEANDNKVALVHCTEPAHVQTVMEAGGACTIASMYGLQRIERDGYHVFRPSGSWAHQMSLTDFRVIGGRWHYYRQNSWGPTAHGTPLNGETPGGAWYSEDDLGREMASRYAEVFGVILFAADLSEPDYSIV